MKFRNPFIKLTASALMLILTAGAMQAIELPIKKINGKEYYYYQVKPKETIYSLCKQFGLTKAELIKYNPVVADGLRANQILYFPVDE
ncbi:LysM domain-containing protein, partial [uncultured Muribaculum sp.]